MNKYLVDFPTMTTVWITAPSEEKAREILDIETADVELRLPIGDREYPIELVNFTRRGEYELSTIG